MDDPGIHTDGSFVGALMTVTVDDDLNVMFHQDFDADWSKIEAAMQAVVDRCQQQFADRGRCPFAPVAEPAHLSAQGG